MDQSPLQGGSVRRARERAMAGLPREDSSSLPQRIPPPMDQSPQVTQPPPLRRPVVGPTAGQSRPQRPQGPPGLQNKAGGIGMAISRPTPVPQWPLQGPLMSPASSTDSEPYRPPLGSQPPPRPPRPSRVPSILDGSKIQDPTPSFQYTPQSGRESTGQELSVPETPTTTVSRPSTLSSVGTIPDFPLPVQLPIPPLRRSVNLGPPPSARRGASSFYSNASYVSPIPEESPRSRSHASYASSAAMPESWGTPSPGLSPQYPDAYYDDIIEESVYGDDDQDEARLVRSASVGKMAKPTLVSATTPRALEPPEANPQRPGPSPVQDGPFREGTGYVDGSSSSNTLPTHAGQPVTSEAMLNAVNAASTVDRSQATPSPQPPPGTRAYSRLSAIRRPPRLDIDAVRKAESRGSLTSLPDLIRRATRLAASLERGRRPASRFDDLNDFPDLAFGGGRDGEKEMSYLDAEKHQSGLSDMLAAFPPPAQARAPRQSFRQSIRQSMNSWPLPVVTSNLRETDLAARPASPPATARKTGRRCCGLPLWGFIIVMIVVILLIAAAIIIPIELFVIRRPNGDSQALQQCQAQITCQNGGMNVVTNGFCSCICTNGFTGFDCTVPDSIGCASSNTNTADTNVNNATIGDAIPRLIQQAQLNFSIPLSQTMILSKFNSGNLSCTAENALVTFNGQSSRLSSVTSATNPDAVNGADVGALRVIDGIAFTTQTIVISGGSTFTLRSNTAGPPLVNSPLVSPTASLSLQLGAGTGFSTIVPAPTSFSTIFATTFSFSTSFGSSKSSSSSPTTTPTPTMTSTLTTTMTMSSPTAPVGATFAVTEQVIDFSRVAVLFILQQESLDNAKTAQTFLQNFFTAQAAAASPAGLESARNVTIGNGNTVNLVTFQVTTPNGTVGGTKSTTSARRRELDYSHMLIPAS